MNFTEPKATRIYFFMKIRDLCCILGTAVLLTACSEPEPPRDPSEIVAERAQARWDAVIAVDPEAVYAYETPGVRQQVSAMDYAVQMSRRQITYRDANVMGVECRENRCIATI